MTISDDSSKTQARSDIHYRFICRRCSTNRDRDVSFTIDKKGATWQCWKCGDKGYCKPSKIEETLVQFKNGEVVNPTVYGGVGGDEAKARNRFVQAKEITADCPVGQYLLARKCALPPKRSHLRWIAKHRHRDSGYEGPVMVAALTHPVTNIFMTLHYTWVNPDGTRPIRERRYAFGLPKKHGVCRIYPDDEVTYGLGVTEGVENALTLAHFMRPVWACMDADNLKEFPLLQGIEELTVAVDNDAAGMKAKEMLLSTWKEKLRVITNKTDVNDFARRTV